MDTRELFLAIMNFQEPDRTPVWLVETITGQAERKWCRDEGFPIDKSGTDVLKFDARLLKFNIGDQPPYPTFPKKTLSNGDRYLVTQDIFGFIKQAPIDSSISPTHYIYTGAPLNTIEDWRAMRKRYDPLDIRRYPLDWSDETFAHLNQSGSPVSIGMNWGPARGIKNGYMFGFDRFLEIVAAEPEILEEVFEYWADFLITFMGTFIDKLKIDAFYFKEDGMGFKNSTLVSPDMFRRIYSPHMRKVVDYLRGKEVGVIGYYSSGNLKPLLPSFLDIGINATTPLECAADMDAIALRKEYPELLMIGNISREAIMNGKSAIDEEVRRKVPLLMEKGGYIPAFDDIVMPDMRFEDVKYCLDLIKSVWK